MSRQSKIKPGSSELTVEFVGGRDEFGRWEYEYHLTTPDIDQRGELWIPSNRPVSTDEAIVEFAGQVYAGVVQRYDRTTAPFNGQEPPLSALECLYPPQVLDWMDEHIVEIEAAVDQLRTGIELSL